MRARLAALPLYAVLAVLPGTPVIVGQKGKAFSATTVTIKIGEQLVIRNDDDVTHNVFSAAPGFAFNVVAMKPGTDHELTFPRDGAFDVRCAFHPNMKLKVTVTK